MFLFTQFFLKINVELLRLFFKIGYDTIMKTKSLKKDILFTRYCSMEE